MKPRKIPERKCLGCGEVKAKRDLIRIVRSPTGEFSLDTGGKKPGRGAYICPRSECLKALKKNHGLERAFKQAVSPEIYDLLVVHLAAAEQ